MTTSAGFITWRYGGRWHGLFRQRQYDSYYNDGDEDSRPEHGEYAQQAREPPLMGLTLLRVHPSGSFGHLDAFLWQRGDVTGPPKKIRVLSCGRRSQNSLY